MARSKISRLVATAGGMAMLAAPMMSGAALAQTTTTTTTTTRSTTTYDSYGQPAYSAPTGDYRNPAAVDAQQLPPEPQAPAGYDGRDLPPPPAGYAASSDGEAQRAADARYAAEAQRWAAENCVKSRDNTGTGALIGGLLGAIVGNSVAGRHDRGAGTVVGAIVGAGAGAAVGSTSGGQTSPGCPPGFVLRNDAAPYAYAPQGYYYAAPDWYRPWVYEGGIWAYRPYPYHDWYYRTYRSRGYYGRPYGGPSQGHYGDGEHRRR